jgi:uncharacterized membrane protein
MVNAELDDGSGYARIVVRPNRAMSWNSNLLFLASVAAPCLAVAGGFAAQGLWLVLPFAGLEILAVAAGLYCCHWRLGRCEVISFHEQSVEVTTGRRRPEAQTSFSRPWARVELQARRPRWYPSRLLIRAQGKELELGAFLCEEEKARLAMELKQILGRTP